MIWMQKKPDFKRADPALDWARAKYAEREKDLMGAVPPIEQFLISVVEMMAIQNRNLETIAKRLEDIRESLLVQATNV